MKYPFCFLAATIVRLIGILFSVYMLLWLQSTLSCVMVGVVVLCSIVVHVVGCACSYGPPPFVLSTLSIHITLGVYVGCYGVC